jgi:hypothetical protein
VLKDVLPAAGVVVGLAEHPANGAIFTRTRQTTSDEDGRFAFERVAANREFWLFARMAPLAAQNRAAVRLNFRSGREGGMTEVAELNLHPAHTLRGRVVFRDRPDQLPAVNVRVTRVGLADSQQAAMADDGSFAFAGIPSEPVVLSFGNGETNPVRGYRLSPANLSVDSKRAALRGRVDEDLDVSVLFEPGEGTPPDAMSYVDVQQALIEQQRMVAAQRQAFLAQQQRLAMARPQVLIQNQNGVVVQQVAPAPRVLIRDVIWRLDRLPLRGMSGDANHQSRSAD